MLRLLLLLSTATAKAAELPRIAIIISGELRSANLTWAMTLKGGRGMWGDSDPPTPARTTVERLFKPLINQGFAIDVFMFQTTSIDPLGKQQNAKWNGDPRMYVNRIGDSRGCRLFSDADIFNVTTPNFFFCLVEREQQLLNPFIRNFEMWKGRGEAYGRDYMNEAALQQLYGHYRANVAAKQFAILQRHEYAYKIRTRPDFGYMQPFPKLATLRFDSSSQQKDVCAGAPRTILASKRFLKRGQLIDMFNVGLAEDMDRLLDRYQDLTGNSDFFGQYQGGWTVESHLVFLMHQKYNICVADSPLIWADAVREEFRCAGITGCRSQQPMPIQQFWTDLSGKLVHREGS